MAPTPGELLPPEWTPLSVIGTARWRRAVPPVIGQR